MSLAVALLWAALEQPVVADTLPRAGARAPGPADTVPRAAVAAAPTPSDSGRTSARSIVPAVGFAPETGLVLGVAAFAIQRDAGDRTTRPSTANALVSRSLRAQTVARVGGELWARGNRARAQGFVQYARVPFPFFGVGRGSDQVEEDYTPESVTLYAEAQRRVGRGWFLGGGLEWTTLAMRRREPGGALAADTLPGSAGSRVLAASLQASYDTRDDLFQPRRGQFTQLTLLAAPRALGSSVPHGRVTADLRGYRAIGAQTVVAAQLLVDHASGTVPFDRLPTIGGPAVGRGYFTGRFRDREAVALQGELRQAIRQRAGLVLFAGVAQVGAGLGEVFTAVPRPFAGAGVRWRLTRSERLAVRVDYGVTRVSRGVYLAVGEAF